MFKRNISILTTGILISVLVGSCKVPAMTAVNSKSNPPAVYDNGIASADTTNIASLPWSTFFTDKNLAALIDTALKNNQELLITLQEIEIARNDIPARQGALLPHVSLGGGLGVEKVGRYTSQGAGDATTEIKPGKEMPDPLPDLAVAVRAGWEVDIWNKLHNEKQEAVMQYLATAEGKNFVLTNLIAEVANSYYELLGLDEQMAVVRQNITLQQNALEVVRAQKDAARVTELAVQKFQAELMRSQSTEMDLLQQVKETENKINFLLGRYPQPIVRNASGFLNLVPPVPAAGIPSQLLANRPDIRQAEYELAAAKLDVKIARAEFYPSLDISAALGLQAFNPGYLVKTPESLLYSLAGDMAGPLINRNAIKAQFNSASARQLQALYEYDRAVLNAYLEVSTQLSSISNLGKNYDAKSKQVATLTHSIDIANELFKSARADYLEVLMTQRDALEAKLELIETKKEQMNAVVNIYRDLGGGWR